VEVEKYIERSGVPYTIFQPLYIYGPHTAKDCEQWFIDRIIRCVDSCCTHGCSATAPKRLAAHGSVPVPTCS
jgi:hypothetical protein